MASSPDTNNIGVELQAAGENLNTWGSPKLNNALTVLSRISSGWNALAVTGNYTVSDTNYSTSNVDEVGIIKFTGMLTSAWTFTMASRAKRLLIWNASGAAVTIALAASNGFSLPNGRWTWVGTDGATDCYNLGSNYGGVTSPSNAQDIPNYSAVQTLIANANIPASAGTVLNSGLDTTAGYLSQKLTAVTGGGIIFSTLNPAGNEQRQAALDINDMSASTNVSAADTFPLYDSTAGAVKKQARAYVVGTFGLVTQASSSTVNPAVAGNFYPVDCTAGVGAVTGPASATAGDKWGTGIFGLNGCTFNPNGLNYYGSSATIAVPEGITLLYYTGASRGWIDL